MIENYDDRRCIVDRDDNDVWVIKLYDIFLSSYTWVKMDYSQIYKT